MQPLGKHRTGRILFQNRSSNKNGCCLHSCNLGRGTSLPPPQKNREAWPTCLALGEDLRLPAAVPPPRTAPYSSPWTRTRTPAEGKTKHKPAGAQGCNTDPRCSPRTLSPAGFLRRKVRADQKKHPKIKPPKFKAPPWWCKAPVRAKNFRKITKNKIKALKWWNLSAFLRDFWEQKSCRFQFRPFQFSYFTHGAKQEGEILVFWKAEKWWSFGLVGQKKIKNKTPPKIPLPRGFQ